MSDNPILSESANPVDVNGGAALFANMIDPAQAAEEVKKEEAPNAPGPKAEMEPEPDNEAVSEEASDDPTYTVKVDGKEIEVKLSELKNGYQRQADYTRKTMEVAEQRKAVSEEATKARQERESYQYALNQAQALLQAQLQDQGNTDWQKLIDSDPIEYLKQRNLYEQRQAKLQQVFSEQQRVEVIKQAEQQKAQAEHLQNQAKSLLDKLPEWKDASKAKAEREAISQFLLDNGFSKQEVDNVADHRSVILARKAMMFDQMIAKAKASEKKVEKVPGKIERPGNSEPAQLDKRSAAYQRLNKSGSVDDAAAVFASFV